MDKNTFRIRKIQKGAYAYYEPQIRTSLFWGKWIFWTSFSAFEHDGSIYHGINNLNRDWKRAEAHIKTYANIKGWTPEDYNYTSPFKEERE